MRRVFLYLAIFLVVVYLADFIAARAKPLSSVEIHPYYAIHLKDKKVEFDFDVPTETQSCVQSVAPHFGYSSCWYLKRNTAKRIDK